MTLLCCASCGIAEIDDVKLVPCDGCDLVKYCSDECREIHKSEHEGECRKRAAELRDELLFKQPESSCFGDCPICCLPLPLDLKKATMYNCCSKIVCRGCSRANWIREIDMRLTKSCPFCREPMPNTQEEFDKLRMKRAEANDPVALYQKGAEKHSRGDYQSAFEYFTKAAELGYADAHYQLSNMYYDGEAGEKDMGKIFHHLEEAAIAGHPDARYALGCHEEDNGNPERAVKHWIIGATQGEDDSMKVLMIAFKEGYISKEDLAAVLRAHQAAINATKSPQRDEAEKNLERRRQKTHLR